MGAICSNQRSDKVAPAPVSIAGPVTPNDSGAKSGTPPLQPTPTRPNLPPVDTLSARALIIPTSETPTAAENKKSVLAPESELPPALATVGKGVSLRGLLKVRTAIRKHFGNERYNTVCTTEVCHQWVKTVTTPAGKCRLVELPGLLDPSEGDVGRPMYFISHAWSNSIELLFRKVFDFLASADDGTRVWLDVLAVCQHESNPAHRADIAAFADVVAACSGGTLVVMDLTRCNPSTRAWCVFEWAHTLASHGPDGLHMSLTPWERAAVFGDLDVERAECFRAADKEMIMREVRRQHGSPEAFNAKLKLQLLLEPLSYTVDLRRLQERSRDTAWEFGRVERWLEDMCTSFGASTGRRAGSRTLCIVSGAGEGKSTISAELVRRLTPASFKAAASGPGCFAQQSHITCAYHFLKYNDQRRLDPVRIVKTIAFQLASRIPSVCSALLDCDVAEVAQLTDVDRAFEMLLLRPLQGVTTPVVILLDALDEAEPQPFDATVAASGFGSAAASGPTHTSPKAAPVAAYSGGPVVRYPILCGNRALQLVTKHLQRLPLSVQFFITTRPDAASGQVIPALERTFRHRGGSIYLKPSELVKSLAPHASAPGTSAGSGGIMVHHTVAKACLSDDKDNEDDESNHKSPSAAPAVASRQDLVNGRHPGGGKPRLASLMGGKGIQLAAKGQAADLTALYCVYGKVFHKAYEWYDLRKRTDVSKLLNVLMAAQEPLSQSLVQQLGLGHAVPLLPGFPVLFFVDEHHLFTLHKSLADWLLLDATVASASVSGTNPLEAGRVSEKGIAVSTTASAAATNTSSYSHFGRRHGSATPQSATTMRGPSSIFGSAGSIFHLSRFSPGDASRAALDSGAATVAAAQAAALAAANAPSPSFHMELAQGHLILGRYLSTTRNSSPSTYCLKYLVTHLAAAGPAAADLLDDVLASFGFIEAVFARGFSANMIRALGRMSHSTRLSRDALRWLRAKQHDLMMAASATGAAGGGACTGPGDTVVNTALMSPLGSELYRVALRVANQGWRTRVSIPSNEEWPADQAVLKGHTGNITAVLFSRDGHQLLSSSGGGQDVRVWDIGSGTCTAVLQGHSADVTCLAMSSDGQVVASGSNDMTCRLWDAATGQCTAILRGHTAAITGVAFAPIERGKPLRLVTSSCDNTMRIWAPAPRKSSAGQRRTQRATTGSSATSATLLHRGQDPRHSCPPMQLDIAMGLTVRGSGSEPTDDIDGVEGCNHTCVQVLQGPQGGLQGVAWAPDGRRLAGAHGADVRLWALPGGKITATLKGHSANVLAVAFSPCDGGRQLASCGWDKVVKVWDTRSNKCVATATGHTELVRSLSWSPEGHRLASASSDNTLRIWDMTPTLTLATTAATAVPMAIQCTAVLRQTEWITAVSFSPDGRSMVSGSVAKELRLWDVASCEAEFAAACASSPVPTASGAMGTLRKMKQKSMKIFNLQEDEVPTAAAAAVTAVAIGADTGAHKGDVTCVALSPDGALLATASQDKSVRLYNSSTAHWLATLFGHNGCVTCVAWAPPPRKPNQTTMPQLASVSHDLTVRIWELDLGDGSQPVQAHCSKTLLGHTDRIRSVAWNPAANGQLATGAEDNHVRVWDSNSGACLATLWGHSNYVTCVLYCPADGGRTVTSASQDSTIRVWDTAKGQVLRMLRGHEHYVNHVTYTPCGSLLASGACDQTVRLWEHASGKCIAVLHGHTHFVNCAAFEFPAALPTPTSPGSKGGTSRESSMPRRLASASTDATVRVWDLKTRKCSAVLQGHAGPVHCVTWVRAPVPSLPTSAPGGNGSVVTADKGFTQPNVVMPPELASGAADHSVRLWREDRGLDG